MFESFKSWDSDQYSSDIKELKVVFFWAPWHPDCVQLAESLKGLDLSYSNGVEFFAVNVDKENSKVDDYNIESLPVVLFLRKNNILNKLQGKMNKEVVVDMISRNLSTGPQS